MFFNVYSYTGPLLGEGVGAYQRQFYGRQICRSNVGFKISIGKEVVRDSQLKSKTRLQKKKNRTRKIIHFTVTGGNEANVDLVLIQPFLLYYVNHVVLMLTSIF